MKLVVLISDKGTGTNVQAIIDGIREGRVPGEIVAVVADTPGAPGLERARKNDVPVEICSGKEDLLPLLLQLKPDYICLAGWKQIIADVVLSAFPDRILNLHPGVVPDALGSSFSNPDGTPGLWNRGMLTVKAIENVLRQGATFAGSSIHFLTPEFDYGRVLGRVFERVLPGDTVDSLYARLKMKENQLYVDVLRKLAF
jgi:folate-dependent phosphoribosylglycinamide formyltransferase PurN